MYEEYAAGTLSLDNYKNKKQEYDRKIAEVQDKIEQSKAEEAAQSVVSGTVRAAAEQAENFLHGTRLSQGVKAEGREEGINIGEMRMLVQLVRDGDLKIERAAEKAKMTVEQFKKMMENTPLGRSL